MNKKMRFNLILGGVVFFIFLAAGIFSGVSFLTSFWISFILTLFIVVFFNIVSTPQFREWERRKRERRDELTRIKENSRAEEMGRQKGRDDYKENERRKREMWNYPLGKSVLSGQFRKGKL